MHLSDITGPLTVPASDTRMKGGGTYTITVPSSPHLILAIAHRARHRGALVACSQAVAYCDRILHSRRIYPSGAKRWISFLGLERFLVIPLDRITLDLARSGLSYVGVTINGKPITLSVSGGSDGREGWTDYVTQTVSTTIDCPVSTMKALNAAALSPAECRDRGITVNLKGDEDRDQRPLIALLARHHLLSILQPGMIVHLERGCSIRGSDIERATVRSAFTPRKNRLELDVSGWQVDAKLDHVDWLATASAFGRQVLPRSVNLIPPSLPIAAA